MKKITFFILVIALFGSLFTGCKQNEDKQDDLEISSIFKNRVVDLEYNSNSDENCDEAYILLGLCNTINSNYVGSNGELYLDKIFEDINSSVLTKYDEIIIPSGRLELSLDFSNTTKSKHIEMINFLETYFTEVSDENITLYKSIEIGENNSLKLYYYVEIVGENDNVIYGNKSIFLEEGDLLNESNLTINMSMDYIHVNEMVVKNISGSDELFAYVKQANNLREELSWEYKEVDLTLSNYSLYIPYIENGTTSIVFNKVEYLIGLDELKSNIISNNKDIEFNSFGSEILNDLELDYINEMINFTSNTYSHYYFNIDYNSIILNGKNVYDFQFELEYDDIISIEQSSSIFITNDESKFKDYLKENNITNNYHLNSHLEDLNITIEDYWNN